MPQKLVFKNAFTLAAGTTNVNFDPLDLSDAAELQCELSVTATDTDAGDTLDVYIQSTIDGVTWDDRVHFTQLIGTLSASAGTPEALRATLQQFGAFSDTEEMSEPSGSAGGSRLTAGTVKNGGFPRPLRRGTVTGALPNQTQMPGASWRVSYVMVDADADGVFTGTLSVYAN